MALKFIPGPLLTWVLGPCFVHTMHQFLSVALISWHTAPPFVPITSTPKQSLHFPGSLQECPSGLRGLSRPAPMHLPWLFWKGSFVGECCFHSYEV